MAHTREFKSIEPAEPPSKRKRLLKKFLPVLVGVSLVVAALTLVFGVLQFRGEKEVATAQRDATADQAITLAEQVSQACASPQTAATLPPGTCSQAQQVKTDPVPAVDGAPGAPGSEGPQGVAGDPGSPGFPGVAGSPGDPGAPGSPGAVGGLGPSGAPGSPGGSGPQGALGPQGAQGVQGASGAPGDAGAAGAAGAQGAQGAPGPAGRGIAQISRTGSGDSCAFVVTFDDGATQTVDVDPAVCGG